MILWSFKLGFSSLGTCTPPQLCWWLARQLWIYGLAGCHLGWCGWLGHVSLHPPGCLGLFSWQRQGSKTENMEEHKTPWTSELAHCCFWHIWLVQACPKASTDSRGKRVYLLVGGTMTLHCKGEWLPERETLAIFFAVDYNHLANMSPWTSHFISVGRGIPVCKKGDNILAP